MGEMLILFISAALINNFVFTRFLGLCIFFGVSKRMDIALPMGFAITFVMVLSSVIGYFLYDFILVPLHIEFLRIVIFVIVIASCVQLVELIIKKHAPTLYHWWGIYLILIATNCIVLSIPLMNVENNFNLIMSIAHAIGSGLGFTLALVLMASIRERLEIADVPRSLHGFAIAFIVAGLLALSFFGFTGMIVPIGGGL